MADKKISQLTSLAQGDIASTTDVLAIVDTSATETKKATPAAIVGAAAAAGLTNVDINSGAIDGTAIGANSASTGAFTTLSASGSVTLSGGTANGVLYLNGSKVATSGANLTYDGTTFTSVGQINVKNDLLLSDATSIQGRAYGDASGVVWRAESGLAQRWHIGSSEQMRLTSTGLGIGTSSPVGKLQVTGSLASFILNTSGTEFYNNYAGQVKIYASNASGFLSFGASGRDNDVVLSTSGNLGIGTTSPAYKLDVAGAINSSADVISQGNDARISLYRSAGINYFDWASGQSLYFSTQTSAGGAGRSTKMVLTDGGNLGIGTSSPAEKLEVKFSTNGYILASNSTDTNTGIKFENTGRTYGIFTDGGSGASNSLRFYDFTAAADRLRLDASGNLGLGVTPSAWSSSVASQVGYGAALSSRSAGNTASDMTHGAYWNGTNWLYQHSSVGAARYQMTGANAGSTHAWFVSAGGTAGNAISFTQAMMLDASGNLGVGTTGPVNKLSVLGKISASDSNFTASAYIHASPDSGADRAIGQFSVAGASNGLQINWNHASSKMHIIINNIPTSSAGLPSGTLYSDGGTIKIA